MSLSSDLKVERESTV